jgi:hypothetical protein
VDVHLRGDSRRGVAHDHREILERDASGVCAAREGVAELMEGAPVREPKRLSDRLPGSALNVPVAEASAATVLTAPASERGEDGIAVLRVGRAQLVGL